MNQHRWCLGDPDRPLILPNPEARQWWATPTGLPEFGADWSHITNRWADGMVTRNAGPSSRSACPTAESSCFPEASQKNETAFSAPVLVTLPC